MATVNPAKLKKWSEVNNAMVSLCETSETEQFQKMNLLTFIQLMETRNEPMCEWKMYSERPDVVTFTFEVNKPEQFMVMNISFVINGTTLFTISDFRKRKYAELLHRLLLVPKYRKKYFYFEYDAAATSYQDFENFLSIREVVEQQTPDCKNLEATVCKLLGLPAAKHI